MIKAINRKDAKSAKKTLFIALKRCATNLLTSVHIQMKKQIHFKLFPLRSLRLCGETRFSVRTLRLCGECLS